MLQIPQLSNYFIIVEYRGPCEITKEYQNFVRSMWLEKTKRVECPRRIWQLIQQKYEQFNNMDQNDSQELILCVLEQLEKSCPIVKEIFNGKIEYDTVSAKGKSVSTDTFSAYILEYSPKSSLLSDMIQEQSTYKVVEGTETVTVTRSNIVNEPVIFMVSFKMYLQKYKVKLDEYLTINSKKYSLFAMSTHQGSIHGGHYIAYTKHHGQWYSKDDGCVSKCTFPESEYHYIAFYKCI
jgi:uncharacterized UBP type Zn finger protein